MEVFVDHAANPGQKLCFTAFLEHSGFFRVFFKLTHYGPQLGQPVMGQRGTFIGMGLPAFRCRTDKFHHAFVFALGHGRPGQVFAVRFVYYNSVRQFHDTFFDTLQVVARAGQNYQHKEVDHVTYRGLRLAYADGFHQDHIIPCRFAEHHCLTALAGHTAQCTAGRRRTDKAVRLTGQVLHTGLVAQNGTAGERAGRVDCQNGHFVTHAAQQLAECLDKRTLACAGDTGNTDAQRPARFWQQPLQYALGLIKIFGSITLDQCNRFG